MPHEINLSCLELAKAIWFQIIRYPMKHLGYSVSQKYYSLIKYEKRKTIYNNSKFCQDLLINDFGLFSISEDFYQTLLLLGAYISGEYSIINKWIDFSVNADSSGKIQPRTVFELLNISPESERVVLEAKQFYEKIIYKNSEIECVWSGRKIHSVKDLHIDHMIPFSLWQNNDLWNLLPSHKKVNALKRDMIPSLTLLKSRKNKIIQYWTELDETYHDRFMKEVCIALTGTKTADNSWDSIFNQLVEKCQYLIETRGLSDWALE